MLRKYHLYLDKETKQMEIHEDKCKEKDKRLLDGKIVLKNDLGSASNKQEVYKKFRNVFLL
ncbi:MAG: hypothetical protein JEZ05_00775 [Tenericutes bacterium]|nr:hypothetical protein [Mycoplasmatota bacterium]